MSPKFPLPTRGKRGRLIYGKQFRYLPDLDTLTQEESIHFITRYTKASCFDAFRMLGQIAPKQKLRYGADPGTALKPIAAQLALYVQYRLGNQLEEAEYIYSLLPTYAQFRALK